MNEPSTTHFNKVAEYEQHVAPLAKQLYETCKSLDLHFFLTVHVRTDSTCNEIATSHVLGQDSINLLKAFALITSDPEQAEIILSAAVIGKYLRQADSTETLQ